MSLRRAMLFLVALAPWGAGCDAGEVQGETSDGAARDGARPDPGPDGAPTGSDDDAGSGFDAGVTDADFLPDGGPTMPPPVEVPEDASVDAGPPPPPPPRGTARTIFLNRRGGTYRAGPDDSSRNTSTIVASRGIASVTLGGYAGSDAAWAQLVACVQDEFARFDVTVTDVEPTDGRAYVECALGGRASALGFPSGVGGIAPIDLRRCSIIERAVVYVFTDTFGSSVLRICEAAAQEIGHAYSLQHELLASDPMTYLGYAGHKTFQDQAAACGEFSPTVCACGRGRQNSVQLLGALLGRRGATMMPPPGGDTVAPTARIDAPADGASLRGNTTLTITATVTDNVGVASAEMLWRFNGSRNRCPGSGSGWTCAVTGSSYAWRFNVGTGDRSFQVRALDAAGNVGMSPERTIRLVP